MDWTFLSILLFLGCPGPPSCLQIRQLRDIQIVRLWICHDAGDRTRRHCLPSSILDKNNQ